MISNQKTSSYQSFGYYCDIFMTNKHIFSEVKILVAINRNTKKAIKIIIKILYL